MRCTLDCTTYSTYFLHVRLSVLCCRRSFPTLRARSSIQAACYQSSTPSHTPVLGRDIRIHSSDVSQTLAAAPRTRSDVFATEKHSLRAMSCPRRHATLLLCLPAKCITILEPTTKHCLSLSARKARSRRRCLLWDPRNTRRLLLVS